MCSLQGNIQSVLWYLSCIVPAELVLRKKSVRLEDVQMQMMLEWDSQYCRTKFGAWKRDRTVSGSENICHRKEMEEAVHTSYPNTSNESTPMMMVTTAANERLEMRGISFLIAWNWSGIGTFWRMPLLFDDVALALPAWGTTDVFFVILRTMSFPVFFFFEAAINYV